MTVLLAVPLVFLSVAGLAVGVMLGRAPLKGSCGGVSCGGACAACPKRKRGG